MTADRQAEAVVLWLELERLELARLYPDGRVSVDWRRWAFFAECNPAESRALRARVVDLLSEARVVGPPGWYDLTDAQARARLDNLADPGFRIGTGDW